MFALTSIPEPLEGRSIFFWHDFWACGGEANSQDDVNCILGSGTAMVSGLAGIGVLPDDIKRPVAVHNDKHACIQAFALDNGLGIDGNPGDPIILEIDCHNSRPHLPIIRACQAA